MDLLKCYQVLDVPQDCTWEELHTAYRRQVQKHHPDRHQQHPDRQLIAKERMLELNKAFDTLAEYYKKNGYLPGDILKKSPIKTNYQSQAEAASPKTSESPTYTPPENKPVKPKQAAHRTSWGLVIIIAILGYYFFWESAPEPINPYTTPSSGKPQYEGNTTITDDLLIRPSQERISEKTDNQQVYVERGIDKETTTPPSLAPLGMQDKIDDGYFFTYGDTPGKVFEVQGVPTRTVGDIWFYGKSEVHFNKGTVVSWYNSPTHPLKAK